MSDVKSWEYYGTSDERTIDRVGYVRAVACALEFLRLMTPMTQDDVPTIFKVKYVVGYHAFSSLNQLIPDLPTLRWPLNGESARHLRNDLVHYTPRHDVHGAHLDTSRPREALVEHYATKSFTDVAAQLDMYLGDLLEETDTHLRS
ncbi:hypothetical protein BKA24_002129 [Microbacterium marinum]|uniref:Uncharacterized protein n=1 Tax=Microbacterium marinum TaxID=421115 RepID=A0A7W7BRC4_9MICO|nr:hypothetical protein [Microbacterium marinum]MBB4667420.1 hypothetical protein [Microbacterium marinum]